MNEDIHGQVIMDLSELLVECTGVTPAQYAIQLEQGYINSDLDPLQAMETLVVDLTEGTVSKADLIDHNDHVLGEILPQDRTLRDRMFVELARLAIDYLCPYVEENFHLQGMSIHEATMTVDLFQPVDPEWLWSEERHESARM